LEKCPEEGVVLESLASRGGQKNPRKNGRKVGRKRRGKKGDFGRGDRKKERSFKEGYFSSKLRDKREGSNTPKGEKRSELKSFTW